MVAIALSPEEQLHVENGGRVFIVEEVPGPLWRVVSVSKHGPEIVVKPDDAEGFSLQREAHMNAVATARASHGPVLLRESRLSYEIDFKCINTGIAWRLRMLQDHQAVGEALFPLNYTLKDSQEAFYAAHEAALMAGEGWMMAARR
jgi:hypothetical protein